MRSRTARGSRHVGGCACRLALTGATLIGEDGVRDVTIAPRNDAAAVAIGGKSWPFDIRLRPWVLRPHIGLLTLRSLAGGDVRVVGEVLNLLENWRGASFADATNGLESGRFQGFFYVQSGHYGEVRCGKLFLVHLLR